MTAPDIRDIRGPLAIPYGWIPLAVAAAVVAAVALGVVVYRLVRRRLRERAKTAAQIALERIERARGLLETASSAELAAEVSDAIRAYIEAAFSVRAAHRTTEEFLRELLDTEGSPIRAHRAALWEFLSWCDLAKFARFDLGGEHAGSLVDAARRFVESTTPTKPTTRRKGEGHSASADGTTPAEVGT